MGEGKTPDAVWGRGRRLWPLRLTWRAGRERDRDEREGPRGGWLTDELVIRADFDRLRAYDLGTGTVRWTWQVPDRDVLLGASRDVADGVVLVAHHDDGSGSDRVRVAAVDVTAGERLWSREYFGYRDPGFGPYDFNGSDPCTVLSGRHVASATGKHLRSVDARDGAELRRVPLPAEAKGLDLWVASVDPFVAVGKGRGKRGEWRVFVVDSRGQEVTSAPLSGPYDRIRMPAAVVDGMLVAQIAHPNDSADATMADYERLRIGGFDLFTGELRWKWKAGKIDSVLPHRGRLLVLHSYGHKIAVLDARDGRVIARRRLRGSGLNADLRVAGDRFAVFGGSADRHPLRVFRWR
ncbi:outer membrane protein assembly factor BamB family protein [Streptomyces beihaiensis]|uniref:PQQ-like beta-propeller repeat protein n=1 Tax=Streptomyces beihaiensis TaxID=2984495 RepID=A0ABT3TUC6_9ACTN|nr:PQQ-binding-like beta-propeller repeat protein [Streptomyces beihaiensis]MCX3060638.1 PQQ-like beta-propeller repeat protein [Streptomyces beihaiensis]